MESLNTLRLANKGQWVFFRGDINGHAVQYKAFDLYVQVFRINGIDHALGHSCNTVKAFKAGIEKAFNYHTEKESV